MQPMIDPMESSKSSGHGAQADRAVQVLSCDRSEHLLWRDGGTALVTFEGTAVSTHLGAVARRSSDGKGVHQGACVLVGAKLRPS